MSLFKNSLSPKSSIPSLASNSSRGTRTASQTLQGSPASLSWNVSAFPTPNLFSAFRRAASADRLSKPEAKLASQIQQYRQTNGLPAIRLSKALTLVANRHVQDLAKQGTSSALHSWSDAPYDSSNPATYPSMWEAPQRLKTGYPGNGYEIAYWTSAQAKPAEALTGWKNSPSHNSVILNQDIWQKPWKAMGVGIYQNYAVVWFGNQRDTSRVTQRDRTGQLSTSKIG
jgi:uncharacterized protein YkwD